MIFDRKEKVGPEGRLRDHNGLVELCIGTVSAQNMVPPRKLCQHMSTTYVR